ncbi:MAG: hypothetical protein U5N85_20395 [Arcicella sp.]|nr:hypothetical protein [Arcicella sp.]
MLRDGPKCCRDRHGWHHRHDCRHGASCGAHQPRIAGRGQEQFRPGEPPAIGSDRRCWHRLDHTLVEADGAIVASFNADLNTTLFVLQRAATASNVASVTVVAARRRCGMRVARRRVRPLWTVAERIPGICSTLPIAGERPCISALRTSAYAGAPSPGSNVTGQVLVYLRNGRTFGSSDANDLTSAAVIAYTPSTNVSSVFTSSVGPITVLTAQDRTVIQREVFLSRGGAGDGPVVRGRGARAGDWPVRGPCHRRRRSLQTSRAALLEYANGRNGVGVVRLWRRPPAFSTLPREARFERLLVADLSDSGEERGTRFTARSAARP